eukprot:6178527-Pleurochrysis_carterae.AAC.1
MEPAPCALSRAVFAAVRRASRSVDSVCVSRCSAARCDARRHFRENSELHLRGLFWGETPVLLLSYSGCLR